MAFCISVQVFSFLQHQAVFRRTQFLRHRIVVYRVYRQPLAGQVQPQYALFLSVLWSLYSLLYRQICSFVFIWYILLQNNPKSGYNVSMNLAADFFKKESRSPRGFLPRPLLRAGESVAPPPLPQKNSGGAYHFRFRFLDLCIRFGKIISKACPVGNLFSFGVCEGFNSGATNTWAPMSSIGAFVFVSDGRARKGSSNILWMKWNKISITCTAPVRRETPVRGASQNKRQNLGRLWRQALKISLILLYPLEVPKNDVCYSEFRVTPRVYSNFVFHSLR